MAVLYQSLMHANILIRTRPRHLSDGLLERTQSRRLDQRDGSCSTLEGRNDASPHPHRLQMTPGPIRLGYSYVLEVRSMMSWRTVRGQHGLLVEPDFLMARSSSAKAFFVALVRLRSGRLRHPDRPLRLRLSERRYPSFG